jgi:hypothetical protein
MSEGYMTVNGAEGLADVLEQLNSYFSPDNWWQFHMDLTVNVSNKQGTLLGQITWNSDEGGYVFRPLGYQPYEPVLDEER